MAWHGPKSVYTYTFPQISYISDLDSSCHALFFFFFVTHFRVRKHFFCYLPLLLLCPHHLSAYHQCILQCPHFLQMTLALSCQKPQEQVKTQRELLSSNSSHQGHWKCRLSTSSRPGQFARTQEGS